jgi:alpha-D-ribose 1-methylphosphonate 5-triphosphate diphosphatase
MTDHEIHGVDLAAAGFAPGAHDIVISGDGRLLEVEPTSRPVRFVLRSPMVDLHLDVIPERRRPRATVELDLETVVSTLDAEVAASGIGTVCIGVRCEEEPGKGLRLADAAELARTLERIGDRLSSDWRVHARVEVTDEGSVEALAEVLACSTRMALVSIMEHSAQRSRFGSEREHIDFYARDWGLPIDEVERIMERKRRGALNADDRRIAAAELALAHGVPLGTHDDRTADQVRAGAELGATVAEFPLTMEAARAATERGMTTVLGAPNVVRRRSTSPGNLLASDAIRAGVLDSLCSDYLPSALLHAPGVLAEDGVAPDAVEALVAINPGRAIGIEHRPIAVAAPLHAALIECSQGPDRCVALWRSGRLTFATSPLLGTEAAVGASS